MTKYLGWVFVLGFLVLESPSETLASMSSVAARYQEARERQALADLKLFTPDGKMTRSATQMIERLAGNGSEKSKEKLSQAETLVEKYGTLEQKAAFKSQVAESQLIVAKKKLSYWVKDGEPTPELRRLVRAASNGSTEAFTELVNLQKSFDGDASGSRSTGSRATPFGDAADKVVGELEAVEHAKRDARGSLSLAANVDHGPFEAWRAARAARASGRVQAHSLPVIVEESTAEERGAASTSESTQVSEKEIGSATKAHAEYVTRMKVARDGFLEAQAERKEAAGSRMIYHADPASDQEGLKGENLRAKIAAATKKIADADQRMTLFAREADFAEKAAAEIEQRTPEATARELNSKRMKVAGTGAAAFEQMRTLLQNQGEERLGRLGGSSPAALQGQAEPGVDRAGGAVNEAPSNGGGSSRPSEAVKMPASIKGSRDPYSDLLARYRKVGNGEKPPPAFPMGDLSKSTKYDPLLKQAAGKQHGQPGGGGRL